jgi:DNA-binding transcriptional MerR regulator
MRAFVQMRQFILQNRDLIFSIEELRRKLSLLEQSGEETLAAMNDLSEDTRRELDDIYIALAEMANTKKDVAKPNRIGFIKDE